MSLLVNHNPTLFYHPSPSSSLKWWWKAEPSISRLVRPRGPTLICETQLKWTIQPLHSLHRAISHCLNWKLCATVCVRVWEGGAGVGGWHKDHMWMFKIYSIPVDTYIVLIVPGIPVKHIDTHLLPILPYKSLALAPQWSCSAMLTPMSCAYSCITCFIRSKCFYLSFLKIWPCWPHGNMLW